MNMKSIYHALQQSAAGPLTGRLKGVPGYQQKAAHGWKHTSCATNGDQDSKKQPAFLSDYISFQSDDEDDHEAEGAQAAKPTTDEVIQSATSALDAARKALERQQEQTPSRPSDSFFTFSSDRSEVKGSVGRDSGGESDTRSVLQNALSDMQDSDWDSFGSVAIDDEGPSSNTPSWARSAPSGEPQLQEQEQAESRPQLDFAEPASASFDFISQEAIDMEAARSAVLPPLQSVVELTSAAAPPQRGAQPVMATASTPSAGRMMEDGEGVLQDGTQYKRESGETKGKNGYWYRWTKLSGVSSAGKVEWEEKWWQASDWAGMKELGAEKSGCRADGAAWRETWREAIGFDGNSGEPMVERSAHKWAQDASGDEWEEKWGEHYWSKGKAEKWADKWGKEGANVWHEKWGEDYAAGGDKCFKYTDKWAEKRVEGGATEQWGDKWEEDFAQGKGGKKGETWSVDGAGNRYQRWWGENHFGDGWVQKFGNSNTGEAWDVSEQMDTYYNPIPHFGYRLALDHSPTLKKVPVQPRAGDDLGEGVDSL